MSDGEYTLKILVTGIPEKSIREGIVAENPTLQKWGYKIHSSSGYLRLL